MKKYTLLFLCALIYSLPIAMASNMCMSHIQRIERQEGIPINLLAAMAQVESGRYNKSKRMVEPWPWTVQSQGKSNYFSSKAEAVSFVKNLQRQGINNIDIGCMQMNIEHHGHKFSSVEQMFEPAVNVAQGAKYLKQLKLDKNKAWSTAVGNYHSFTPEHHNRYKNLVLKKLSQVNKELGAEPIDQGMTRGSLYPGGSGPKPAVYNVSASLYSYNRTPGVTGARKPVRKQTHKIVRVSSPGRIAMMKSRGVNDMAFMDKKDTE